METHNPAEQQKWLSDSLKLFIKGARILDIEKLREVVGDYQHLRYAKGTKILESLQENPDTR